MVVDSNPTHTNFLLLRLLLRIATSKKLIIPNKEKEQLDLLLKVSRFLNYQ